MPQSEKRLLEAQKAEDEYNKNLIYAGSDFNELKEAASVFSPKDFIGPVNKKKLAGGGLAYLMGM